MEDRIIGKIIESGELSEKAKGIRFNDGILREHNHDAYIKLVDAMEKEGKACAIRATGTGKMYLAVKWLNDNSDKPFVYVAPTNVILNRFVDTLVDTYFNKEDAKKIKTMALEDEIRYLEENLGLKLHLYTYSKIRRMSIEEMEAIKASHIVLDEFHRCGADKWGKSIRDFLRINSKAKVMGLSATPIRPSDGKNMVSELFDGRIASELTLIDALKQKILPVPVMVNAIYSFQDEIVSLENKIKDKNYDPEKKKEINETFKQIKQLVSKSEGVKAIFRDFVEEITRQKGKQDIRMVVFCKDIADRDKKMDECEKWFEKGTKIKKYSVTSRESEKVVKSKNNQQSDLLEDFNESSKSKKLREKVIDAFQNDNSKGVKLLFAVDMLNEGLHIDGLDGVVMLRDTNSNIIFLQQLGRALSVSDNRTTQPWVFDFVNNIESLDQSIGQYREIVENLNESGKREDKVASCIDFEIQRQIIDLIKYLNDISYTFEDRIAPLIAYYKEFGTIADIITSGKNQTQYEFNGQTRNLGNLINALRQNKDKLEQKAINLLESMGIVWDYWAEVYRKNLEMFEAYFNDPNGGNGTLANIKWNEKYVYQGKTYLIGSMKNNLCTKKKDGDLDIKIERKLTQMGFRWTTQVSNEIKIEILTAYSNDPDGGNGTLANIKNKGTVYVYEGVEYDIGRWKSKFCENKKAGKLDSTVERQLTKLGLKWEDERYVSVDEKISILTAYSNDPDGGNGTIGNISSGENYLYEGQEYPIGNWISDIRRGRTKLNGPQKDKINKLGMVWNKIISTEAKIMILRVYSDDPNGGKGTIANIRKIDKYIYKGVEYPIGDWMGTLRNLKKDTEKGGEGLTITEIEDLEKLGMVWIKQNRTKKSTPAPSSKNLGR